MRDDNLDDPLVSQNVRYSLWKKEIPKVNWVYWLTNRLPWDEAKGQRFLRGQLADDKISLVELTQLSIQLGLSDDGSDLRFENLVQVREDLLQVNLKFLFDGLEHGKKKDLAKRLGVNPTTISRWLSGIFEPRESVLRQLVLYFGLSVGLDLRTIPIFLSLEPITQTERRAWLINKVKNMSLEELNRMYPALERIFWDQVNKTS